MRLGGTAIIQVTSPILLRGKPQMPMGCMICREMCMSGARIQMARTGCYGAAVGTSTRCSAGQPVAPAAAPTTGTTSSGSASRGSLSYPWLFYPLTLWVGFSKAGDGGSRRVGRSSALPPGTTIAGSTVFPGLRGHRRKGTPCTYAS